MGRFAVLDYSTGIAASCMEMRRILSWGQSGKPYRRYRGLVMSRFGKCFALFLVSLLSGFEILGDG